MGDVTQDQRSMMDQLDDLRGYAKHRGMYDADDWIAGQLSKVDREQDLQDLRSMLGSRHIERCSTCDRYKFLIEVCPNCNELYVDRGLGRYAPGVISTQSEVKVEPEVLRRWANAPMGRESFIAEIREAIVDEKLDFVDVQVGRGEEGVYVEATARHDQVGIVMAKVPPETSETRTHALAEKLGVALLERLAHLKKTVLS